MDEVWMSMDEVWMSMDEVWMSIDEVWMSMNDNGLQWIIMNLLQYIDYINDYILFTIHKRESW